MPRNTISPDAVEAVRKALEQLISKPKSVTERSLIEAHKDLVERALANGYDFKDIAGVASAVGVDIPVARIRKYYQEVQGIPKRTRRKRDEANGTALETNGNGAAPKTAPAEAVSTPAAIEKNGKSTIADDRVEEVKAPAETTEAPPAETPAKSTRRRTTSSRTGTSRSSTAKTEAKSGRGASRGTGRTTGRKKTT